MKRRLFNLAAVVSLGMMLAVVGLWVRSYGVLDMFSYWRAGSWWSITSDSGRLYFTTNHLPGFRPTKYGWTYRRFDLLTFNGPQPEVNFLLGLQVTTDAEFLGFQLYRADGGWRSDPGARLRQVSVPLWFIVLPIAIFTAWRLRSATRNARCRREGLCPRCGYDLRATPDRCPECGMAVAPKPAEAAA